MLYVRLAEKRESAAVGEDTPDGFIILRDAKTDEAVGLTVVNWWKRFGIAATVHAVWNGGSLLVMTLGGANFFGDLPPEIDILGLSATGTTLAFLLILGLSALWIGRAYGHDKPLLPSEVGESEEVRFIPTDRAIAIWAVACLIAIVPAGIAGLKLWLG